MCNTIVNNEFVIEGRTRDCICEDGRQYEYATTCTACNGNKKVPSKNGNRLFKCKPCSGSGWVSLENRVDVGVCRKCEGTLKVPLTITDVINSEERDWVFNNLFDFNAPYTGSYSEINEGYFGFNIVCGCTDYGRYKLLSEDDFRSMVKESFDKTYIQYISLMKNNKLPTKIVIRRGDSGWFAYAKYQ